MREGELAQALDDIWGNSSTRNWIIGRLGELNGTVAGIDVTGRPGYVYISMGPNGDQGITIAKDKIGVAKVVFQEVRMRRELGELVIREASSYAGGNGNGGGSDTLAGLSDVAISSPASGQALVYNGTKWANVTGGTGMVSHPHEGGYHTGQLNWGTVNKTGSALDHIIARDHDMLEGIGPDQHHPKNHPLVGPEHTAQDLIVGQTIRATSATTFVWTQLKHTDLDPTSIGADQHHARTHGIIAGDAGGPVHTTIGDKWAVVGSVEDQVLGLIMPTHDPGSTERLLKTHVNGSIRFGTTLLDIQPGYSTVRIDDYLLYADADNNWIGINRPPSGAALDVTSTAIGDITLRVKQKAGQNARIIRIEDAVGQELIVMDSVGNLQSGNPGFYSGLQGWQVSHTGNAEFNNIWARGELHASVFVKDEVHATGGTFMVATAGKLHSDAPIDAGVVDVEELDVESDATNFPDPGEEPLIIQTDSPFFNGSTLSSEAILNFIEIDDPPSGAAFYFSPGEIVRVKTEIDQTNPDETLRLSDLWLEILSAKQGDGFSTYSVIKRSGTDSTIPKGSGIVSYGQRGDGRILMTSDLNYAPYIDVFTTGENPWTGLAGDIIPRMRMGQLQGVGVLSGVSQYGMIAGLDLTDINSGYFLASNLGIRMYKVPLTFNNGVTDTGLWSADGNIRIGKNIGQDATTGFRVITKSDIEEEEGNVIIGNTATGNFLRWNQFTGILTVSGSLIVTDPGSSVTKIYVDEQDIAYDLLAKGYGGTAETNSTNYIKNRRVTKVTGTWTSGTSQQISWAGVKVYFGDGAAARSITDGTTGVITEDKYLYIKWVAGTSTFAMQILTATQAVSDPDYILIATVKIGANGSTKAGVTIVAGSTFISGGNIFTNAIQTAHINADAVRANHIFGGEIYVRHMNAETGLWIDGKASAAASSAAGTAQTSAQLYGNRRRVVGVSASAGSAGIEPHPTQNSSMVRWTGLVVRFASGNTTTVTNNTGVVISTTLKTYFYIDIGTGVPPTSVAMQTPTTDVTIIGPDDVLIAVADPMVATSGTGGGSGYPTLSIVAGSTYISGDAIITNSIVAQNIRSDAIQTRHMTANTISGTIITGGTIIADKLNVSDLNAINAVSNNLNVTGDLILGSAATPGRIYSSGKSTYANTNPGFFLGYDGAFRFNIGHSTAFLKWDGDDLVLRTKQALLLQASADSATLDQVLQFTDRSNSAGSIGNFRYTWGGTGTIPVFHLPVLVKASYFEANNIKFSDTSQISKETLIWDFAGIRHSMSFRSQNAELVFTGSFVADGGIITPNLSTSGDKLIIANPAVGLNGNSAGLGAGQIMWGWDSGSSTWNLYLFAPDGPPGTATYRWRRVVLNRM